LKREGSKIMSTARIRNLSIAIGLVLLAAVAMTVWAFTGRTQTREVTLYARDMAFFLPGSAERNPPLRVFAGETVRFTLVNDEPGMKHDLAVAELGLVILPLDTTPGSRGTAVIEVPQRPGRYAYVCELHTQMMRGVLDVLPAP
jgi:plastocyanin